MLHPADNFGYLNFDLDLGNKSEKVAGGGGEAKAPPPARSLFVVNSNHLRPYLGPPLKCWITFHPPCLPLTFGQKQQGRGEIYGGREGTNFPQRKVPPSCTVLLKTGRIVGTQRDRNVSRS